MNGSEFNAVIVDRQIHCQIKVPHDMAAPVFCFSLMAPPAVVSGGTMIRTDGGYGELRLPDLVAGLPHSFVLTYAHPDYKPVNRAWLPLGGYLRTESGVVELPKLPAGVRKVGQTDLSPPETLSLIPHPQKWTPTEGVANFDKVSCDAPHWENVEVLAQRCNLAPLQSKGGLPCSLAENGTLRSDAYRIAIFSDRIEVEFGGVEGAHYAGITLLVLRETHNRKIPCGVIEDQPRFEWRGQHLDCARHFYHCETITSLIDVMALLKMNRFHWHFSDDEAFRLELDCIPELWQKTSTRGEGQLIPGVFGGGHNSSGSYSKSDARNIIEHASKFFIEVMPEIEFPAHALGFARALPSTRDPADTGDEVSVQGYARNVLNPAMPETWRICEAIVDEVSDLFPFDVLHLGADELPTGTWSGSPAVNALKKRHGLRTSDDVLGWSLSKLAQRLSANKARSAAWEEAARGSNGGIGNNAILFSWTGQQAGIDAAKAGYDIVMSPAQNVYLDMSHSDAVDDWGAAWAAYISLQDTITWQVIPDPAIQDRIIGVEGTFWSEFTTVDKEMEPMIAPRILGVASKAWSDCIELDPQQFMPAARAFCEILTLKGWEWNAACFD